MNELGRLFTRSGANAPDWNLLNRDSAPPTTIYFISDRIPTAPLFKLSCMYCKRTIADARGHIDTIIETPLPIQDENFVAVLQIKCKNCGQLWRIIVT